MGVHLKIDGIDVSGFITTDSYSAESAPVFDKESEFVNIYGETVRTRVGTAVTVNAVLSDVDDVTARGLSAAFEKDEIDVVYSAPDEKSAVLTGVKLSLSLDRVFGGKRFWTAKIGLHSDMVPDDGEGL